MINTIRDLYIKAMNLIGKEQMEKKQKAFLVRVIQKAEQDAENINADEWKKKKAIEILSDLNIVCMTHFRDTSANLTLIYARLAESYTLEDFKAVHRIKASQWLASEKFRIYLRPSTLYNSKNFESYLNEALVKNSINEKPKRHWKDYKTLQELLDNRKDLDIPGEIKDLYALFAVSRDKNEYEKMNKLNELYKQKLEA